MPYSQFTEQQAKLWFSIDNFLFSIFRSSDNSFRTE